jgi:hypothetical protein
MCRTPFKDLSEEFGLQPVKGLWTVEKRLGGWKAVQTEFFDDTVGCQTAHALASNVRFNWHCMLLQGICSEILRDVGARKVAAEMASRRR